MSLLLLLLTALYVPATERPRPAPPAPKKATVYHVTEETEVFLDGKRVEYEDVPKSGVEITVADADDDGNLTRLEFRSK